MPAELTLASAFLVGFFGSVHCAGMCGGIVGALTLGASDAGSRRRIVFLFLYNLGRLASYAVAGAVAGALGAGLLRALPLPQAQQLGAVLSGGFMIALGMYLAGWWRGLAGLERMGARLWSRIEPLGRRLLPIRTPSQALAAGLLWGWLPCGMVYAALAWTLTAPGAIDGALLMLFFGIGTLPMLLALGLTLGRLDRLVRRPNVRRLAGLLVIGFGLWLLLAPGRPEGHDHAARAATARSAGAGHGVEMNARSPVTGDRQAGSADSFAVFLSVTARARPL